MVPHELPNLQIGIATSVKIAPSLLDEMKDGNEYGSIVSLALPPGHDMNLELRRALAEVEAIRGRPCLLYASNLIKKITHTAIEAADHLPFNEMVNLVPSNVRAVDVFLATPGGSGEQVNLFVEALRARFDDVQFLIPYKAMSAGTLWALSGDEIWMDSRAFLGPLDPQVPTSDGTFAPAQALLILLDHIQREGAAKLAQKQQPDWSHVVLLQKLDHQQLGRALSSSKYVIEMAKQFLLQYKFKSWVTHEPEGTPVTPDERLARATRVAEQLCSHELWKAHGHAISREALYNQVRLRVRHAESIPGCERAMRRLWALCYYLFDKMPIAKIILSQEYAYFRFGNEK